MPLATLDAEIIAVGSEMLTSQRIDTNSLFLAGQLNTLGIEVRQKLVVCDDRALITAAVKHAMEHASLVIVTGGLGPTEDDLTREAVAAAVDRELFFDDAIAREIEDRFRRRGRKMAEINKRQAYVIAGAQPLPNARGTAPGQWLDLDDRAIVLLPGPPSELHDMFTQQVMPRLRESVPATVIRTRFYRVTGMTESDLDALIAPVYTKFTNPATTVLASAGDIQVHLRARCSTAEEADRLLAEAGDPIEELLGPHLYSRNGDSIEQVIATLLQDRCHTVSTAESCTGGMVGERLTSLPGSSKCFLGGFLTYNNDMKAKLLGVDPALIEQHTAVSAEVARAMAEGARERTGSHFAVATTGEAGPESSTGAPVGTVFVGLARPDGPTLAMRYQMPGDRERIRGFTTNAALDLLRRAILKMQ